MIDFSVFFLLFDIVVFPIDIYDMEQQLDQSRVAKNSERPRQQFISMIEYGFLFGWHPPRNRLVWMINVADFVRLRHQEKASWKWR